MNDSLETGRHTEIHRKIAAALAELVPDDPSLPPHPYLRRHLAEHAAAGHVLDDTHVPPALLPWESSLDVRRLLATGGADPADSRWLQAWARLEPFSRYVDPLSRAISLRLAHHAAEVPAHGTPPPAPEALAQAPVTPVWSEGRGPDNVWLVTRSRVTSLTTVKGAEGRRDSVVVAGDDQGQLHTLRSDGSTAHAPLPVHAGAITHLLALPGGRLVATGSADGSVAVVDTLQGKIAFVAVPRRARTWVSSLALYRPADHTPVLLAAFSDGYLAALHPAVFHSVDVVLPVLSPDSSLLCPVASPHGERQLLLFTRNDKVYGFDGQTARRLSRHRARVRALLPLPTSGEYAVADERGRVSVHRTDRPATPGARGRHGRGTSVTTLMVTEVEGRSGLLSAGGDGSVRLWSLPDLVPVGRPLPGHTGAVTAMGQVASNNPRLVTAGADRTVRSWPMTSQTFLDAPRARDRITASAPCPSVPHVLASAHVRRVCVLDMGTTERRTVLTGHTATAMAWPRVNGKLHLAAALEDNRIVLIDTRSSSHSPPSRPAHELSGHFLPALALVSLPGADGNTDLLASASADGRVCVWDPRTAKPLATFPDHRLSVRCLATHCGRDGVLLASGGSDGKVRLWDMRRLAQQGPTISCGQHFVNDLAMAPGSDQELLVASAGQDTTLKVWNVRTGEQTGQFSPGDGELSAVTALALPSGRSLFATAGKTSIHVWDPSADRRILQIVTGEAVMSLETVPDRESGNSLLSATGETSTMLFRLHHDRI
ncbi:WD40 repeat domain-containing protein [Streptomyces goshikiensis]|uniref:WD40 repeat domain-containing protein n=1 Tax=Streptomyces goshikiensis TaxID=1942 RepID=UPI0037031632